MTMVTIKKEDNEEQIYNTVNILDEQIKAQINFAIEKVKVSEIMTEIFHVAATAFRASVEKSIKECPEAQVKEEEKAE
jgi:hypothetical protein